MCLSGISAKLALTQAESNYHQANVASKIQEHFTASYEEYSIEEFISFLMDTNIGLSTLAFIKIMADTVFRAMNTLKIRIYSICKEKLLKSMVIFMLFLVF